METWKDIEGYKGLYQVSDLGRIRSLGRICNSKNNSMQKKREKILTQEVTVWGYCRVRLFDENGKSKHYAVHRIVAESFIRLLNDNEEVNHINEIKTDNRLCNLEICTSRYNCNYGNRNKRISEANKSKKDIWCKAVEQIDVKTNEVINIFSSRLEAARNTGIDDTKICACCNNKRMTAGGYKWRNVNG